MVLYLRKGGAAATLLGVLDALLGFGSTFVKACLSSGFTVRDCITLAGNGEVCVQRMTARLAMELYLGLLWFGY